MAKKRPGIGDIAKMAGVSKGAVSFALNGRPGVSEETRKRILDVAEQMEWSPHFAARTLGGNRTGVVGLVIARPARTISLEPFFMLMISGLQSVLSSVGIGLQMKIVDSIDAEIAEYRQWWRERRVDGVILFDARVNDPRFSVLAELEMPAVLVASTPDHGKYAVVWADDQEAMADAIGHLYTLGHRRIAHVHGLEEFSHTRQRRLAVTAAGQSHPDLEILSEPTDFSDREAATATRKLMDAPQRPTAVIYDSDVMALAGLSALMEKGLSVPQDVSIMSFDDSLLTRLTHPSITALSRDTFEFGEEVANSLLRLIETPGDYFAVRVPTPHVTERESTAIYSG